MGELAGLRVLLVEDEGTVALMLEDMLADLQCEVVASAARLDQAFEALVSASPEFAILDVNVAGEVSFDLARDLSERGIPYLFSTGYGNGGLPDDLRDRTVLAKPFTLSSLRKALEEARRR